MLPGVGKELSMRGTSKPPFSRWGMATLAAAVVLGVAAAPAAAAAPIPSPSAAPGAGASTPGGAGTKSAVPPIACTKGPDGHLVNCSSRVPASKMPARAKDQAVVTQAVTDPATLVDTRTWTTGGGNTFPGAEAPFGMVQWSPDTMPGRNAGGGYTFGDTSITGYSLTHVSGPVAARAAMCRSCRSQARCRAATRTTSRPSSRTPARSRRPATTRRRATSPTRSPRSSPRRRTARWAASRTRRARRPAC